MTFPAYNPEGFWRERRSTKHTKTCKAFRASFSPEALADTNPCRCPAAVPVGRRAAKRMRRENVQGVKKAGQHWIGSGSMPR